MKYVEHALTAIVTFAWYIGAAVFLGWSVSVAWGLLVQPHYAVGPMPVEAASAAWVVLGTVTSDMSAAGDRIADALLDRADGTMSKKELVSGLAKLVLPFFCGGMMMLASFTISGLL